MYENSKRYAIGRDASIYLATANATITSTAEREGVSPMMIRTLLQLAAMRASGAQVTASDMIRAGLASPSAIDSTLAEMKRSGWVSVTKCKLSVTSSGRQVIADIGRGWERSARKLGAFANALPFRKRAAKLNSDQA